MYIYWLAADHHKGSFEEGSEDQDSTGKRHRRPTNGRWLLLTFLCRMCHGSCLTPFVCMVFSVIVCGSVFYVRLGVWLKCFSMHTCHDQTYTNTGLDSNGLVHYCGF